MIKYYPLFILRSCLILISAISKHSEEVQDRCELWIIKSNHFLTGLIVWSSFTQLGENNISRIQISAGAESGPRASFMSLTLPRKTSQQAWRRDNIQVGSEGEGGDWWPIMELFIEFWCQPKPIKQSQTPGPVLWEAKQPGKNADNDDDGCRYDLACLVNIGF